MYDLYFVPNTLWATDSEKKLMCCLKILNIGAGQTDALLLLI
jgi:hypothetical protein